MGADWKLDPWPLPEIGPPWPGDDERMTWRGISVQPEPDLEIWDTIDDRWEIGLAATGHTLLLVAGDRAFALSIAVQLATARNWSALTQVPSWSEMACDPLLLRLMSNYPGRVSLQLPEDDLDEIAREGPTAASANAAPR